MKLVIPTIRSEKDDNLVHPVDFEQADTLTLYDRNSEILTNLELGEIKGDTLPEKLSSFILTSELRMTFVSNQQTKFGNVSKLLKDNNIDHWISTGNSVEEMVDIFELGGAFLHKPPKK